MGNSFENISSRASSTEEKEGVVKKTIKAAAVAGMIGVASAASAESGSYPETVPAQESHRLTLSSPENEQPSIENSTEAIRKKDANARLYKILNQAAMDVDAEVQGKLPENPPKIDRVEGSYQEYFTKYEQGIDNPYSDTHFDMPITPDNVNHVAGQIMEGVGVNDAFDSVRGKLKNLINGEPAQGIVDVEDFDINTFNTIAGNGQSDKWKMVGNSMIDAAIGHLTYRFNEGIRDKIKKTLIESGRIVRGDSDSFNLDSRNAKNMYFQKKFENKDSETSVTVGADADIFDAKSDLRAGIVFEQKF